MNRRPSVRSVAAITLVMAVGVAASVWLARALVSEPATAQGSTGCKPNELPLVFNVVSNVDRVDMSSVGCQALPAITLRWGQVFRDGPR